MIETLSLLAVWLALADAGSLKPAPIVVSAAISLTDVLTECGQAFTAAGGSEVRFNFAGSNALARQIVNGAPVDVFISADEAQMRLVESAGDVAMGSRIDLLHNRLAVVVPSSGPSVGSVTDLLRPNIRRIALGDPEAVPAGVYAKQFLQSAGLWDRLGSKIVPVANVRAALRAAETGAVDVAIVYRSDLISSRGVRLAFTVDGAGAPEISYPAAIVAGSKKRAEGARFLAFLGGPAASALFTRYGFEPIRPQH